MLTESEALAILPLSVAKLELRIADSIKEHDALIQRQIWDAVNYCSESTGRGVDDLMPLRAAAMTVVRHLYDRARERKAYERTMIVLTRQGRGPQG